MKEIRPKGVRTWIEINKEALKHNYQSFRKLIGPDCRLMAVAKSNAYGHGLIDYSKQMEKLGCDFIGVDSMTEALALRKEGIKSPILVLGYTLPELYKEAAENNISITISSLDQLKGILRFAQNDNKGDGNSKSNNQDSIINLHIKVDTGMHRQGLYLADLKLAIEEFKKAKNIKVEGVYTHFAAAKNPAFPADTNKQIEEFKKACEIITEAGFNPIRHAAATSGTIIFPASHFDMVRIGIGLYGLWPSLEAKSCFSQKLSLRPALSWKSIISEIKKVPTGEKIGYDFTECLMGNDAKIAVIPIGYWHGFSRSLSSIGHVLIRGQRAKIIGRISMDMMVIDVTGIKNIKIADAITIIGKDGKEEITPEEMASLSDTSWYEKITSLNPLIKRIYL